MKKILYLTFLCLLSSQFLLADCVVKNDLPTDGSIHINGGETVGQTFKACQDGELTSLTLFFDDGGSSSLGAIEDVLIKITAGDNLATAIEVAKFTRPSQNRDLEITIDFHTPFVIRNGQTYTWFLINPEDNGRSHDDIYLKYTATDPGVGGVGIVPHSSSSSSLIGTSAGRMNIFFNFAINHNTVLAPIPTMSQWGLVIFGLLILNLGVVFLYQQETILKG